MMLNEDHLNYSFIHHVSNIMLISVLYCDNSMFCTTVFVF
jgi:hypothetical protein